MGDLVLDLPAKLAPELAVLYRQLAVKLREFAMMDNMDDRLGNDFLDLARQYDARATDV
jgi:hypothetical protein